MTQIDELDASDFSDTEEPIIKTKTKQDGGNRPQCDKDVVLPELNKYGKPKRKMTEKQLAALAAARIKGHAKRKELIAMKAKEKELKSEEFLIKKMELQKKIKAHEKKKRALMKESDSESEEEPPKPKSKGKKLLNEVNDELEKKRQSEIDELKKQLEALGADLKETKKEVAKPKRRIVKTIIESDLEDEEEPEPKPKNEVIQLSRHNSNSSIQSDVSRTSIRRPIMDELPAVIPFKPIKMREKMVDPEDAAFKAKMRELFPNY